jgi:glucose-1-phosphate cytidylyltransferase
MKIYASQGFNDFVVPCGYRGEKLKEYFINLAMTSNDFAINTSRNEINVIRKGGPDWNVTLIDTGLKTLTGGRIKRISDFLDGDTFMLTYGDGVADIDLHKLLDFHKSHGKKATITAIKVPRFGIINLSENGQVISFKEKRLENTPLANGGFMVLSKEAINYIDGDNVAFEAEPMERLVKDNELYAYKHEGFWKAVDSLRDKIELDSIINEGKIKLWKD